MADQLASEVASTIQSAHINHDPDPNYDANPSTTASRKSPVRLRSHPRSSSSSPSRVQSQEIPISLLEPTQRTHNLPPLPDLRFEQSYLARIGKCQSNWSIAWVTFLDHVIMPLSQGMIWHLLVFGWRAGNGGVKFNGHNVGARVRRWWWNVNKWKLPDGAESGKA